MIQDKPEKTLFAGLDAGSTSAKLVITSGETPVFSSYILHKGDHRGAIAALLNEASAQGFNSCRSLCATGSGRKFAGKLTDAQVIKNEITATWRAVSQQYPDTGTIIEIGGQDSKLITMKDGEISGFKLNSVCAAGTGSFIQQQISRLGISFEKLSQLSLSAERKAHFTGRCTVFAETEMVNLQQRGFSVESIAAGLSDAICENYLKDLAPGLTLSPPFLFCGGVAGIAAVVRAFSQRLGSEMIVPPFYKTAAAYGAALLAMDMNSSDEDRPLTMNDSRSETIMNCSGTDCLNCGKCGFAQQSDK